ncbi:class I SAM-dependent methyltransferase [Trichothermofontia sp.]
MKQEFTNDWFLVSAKSNWDQLLPQLQPKRILEIGSYEGASTCYLIRTLSSMVDSLEIYCIDTWEGGIEHHRGGIVEADMPSVERRFKANTEIEIQGSSCPVNLVCYKEKSITALSKLIAQGMSGYFDFIYIDGSHQTPDVLSDAVLAFQLARKGGLIAFDDYLWSEHSVEARDILRCPKSAIDAFVNIFFRKVTIISAPLYQLYVSKVSD